MEVKSCTPLTSKGTFSPTEYFIVTSSEALSVAKSVAKLAPVCVHVCACVLRRPCLCRDVAIALPLPRRAIAKARQTFSITLPYRSVFYKLAAPSYSVIERQPAQPAGGVDRALGWHEPARSGAGRSGAAGSAIGVESLIPPRPALFVLS